MTVIAWDGKTLAADKRMTAGWVTSPIVKKIRRSNGELIAATGNASIAVQLFDWHSKGCDPDTWPECNKDPAKDSITHLIVINEKTGIRKYESSGYPVCIENKFMAWGNGHEAAMAVLHLGFDAKKAVEVTSEIIQGVGNGVDTLEF